MLCFCLLVFVFLNKDWALWSMFRRFRIYIGICACTYLALYHFAFSLNFKVLRVSSILPFYIRQRGLRCFYVCGVMCFVFLDRFKPINRSSQNLMWTLWFKRPLYFCTFYILLLIISAYLTFIGPCIILIVE